MHGGGILWIDAVGSDWRFVAWVGSDWRVVALFAVQLAWAVADFVVRCRVV